MTTPNYSVDEPTPNLGLTFFFFKKHIHTQGREKGVLTQTCTQLYSKATFGFY